LGNQKYLPIIVLKSTNLGRIALKSVGYAKLIQQYNLAIIRNWHESAITGGLGSRTETPDGRVQELFPPAYDPSDELGTQLEFALKYDGTNLLILAKLFAVVPQERIASYIRSKLTGKYARRIWYLYEMFTGTRLPIENLTQGNYIGLLDSEDYYTSPGKAVQRQRIRDNLLGDAKFCPTIRRSPKLVQFEQSNLGERCRQIMKDYDQRSWWRGVLAFAQGSFGTVRRDGLPERDVLCLG
jgi:hypothetical protein